MSILELVQADFSVVQISNNIYTTREHDSLRIFVNTNSFFWYSQRFGGGPKEWLQKVRQYDSEQIEEMLQDEVHSIKKLTHQRRTYETRQFYGITKYVSYFKERGILPETMVKYHLEYDPVANRIIIPIINRFNKRIGAIIRSIHSEKNNRYKVITNDFKPAIWPEQNINLLTPRSKIVLFEGCWSVMRWNQIIQEPNVFFFCILGAYPSKLLAEYFNGISLNVILDNDETGIKLKDSFLKIKKDCKFYLPSKYPDEMSGMEIKKLWKIMN